MKYPNGIKKTTVNKKVNYANRGMVLENDLNLTNKYYLETNKAYIYKKPTPIQLVKVTYPKRVITEAYFKEPSTLDYNGLYKGYYIEFDAKETNNKTSFPLANINSNQINHIKNISNNGGICFLIVRFKQLDRNYLIMGKDFLNYIEDNEKKSIPVSYFEEKAFILELKYNPRLDYLKIIDNIIGG